MNNTAENIESRLSDAIQQAQRSFHRLILLVGPTGTGKTGILLQLANSQSVRYLNVNLQLSQRLLEFPRSKRPRHIDRIFNTLVDEQGDFLIFLDNLEILFDPALQLDPLRLLKAVSRKHTLVAAWNGSIEDGVLSYAEPGHPEYKSYRNVDVHVLSLPVETTPNH